MGNHTFIPVVANSDLAPSQVCVQQDGKHVKVRQRSWKLRKVKYYYNHGYKDKEEKEEKKTAGRSFEPGFCPGLTWEKREVLHTP